jgi:hypothetical protein
MLGFVISSNAIFGFIFSPILGKMSDKFERKPVMIDLLDYGDSLKPSNQSQSKVIQRPER